MTAFDTNVLLDALEGAPERVVPAVRALASAAALGPVIASPVVLAELCGHPGWTPGDAERFLAETRVHVDWAMDVRIWRVAGTSYGEYAKRWRRADGNGPRRLLADFIIGAHALHAGGALVTRDAAFYRRAFPELRVIEPAA